MKKNIFIMILICSIIILPQAIETKNIYKKFNCDETVFVNGIVNELDDRYIIVEDIDGNLHKLWINEYTGYYPSDYTPYYQDSVNVRCKKYSLITNRLRVEEIQFIQENYTPPADE